jgi:hypothetical protein
MTPPTRPEAWARTAATLETALGLVEPEEATSPGRTRYSDIHPESIEWIWRHRIARGKLNSIEGDPGVSKSTLALTIAAHVSTGRPWPDGTECPRGDVLLLTAEDGRADTVRVRLDNAGADVDRIHDVHGVPVTIDGIPTMTEPTLGHIDGLERHILETGAVLVIVDVLMAYLPRNVDSHRDHDVRTALRPLAELAARTRCAIVLIRHLNKGSGPAMYRAGGSIGITGVVRCSNYVAKSPDEPGTVVFTGGKNNVAPDSPGLTYRLASRNEHPVIEWTGETRLSADELLAHSDEDREEHDALTAWLREYLTAQGGEAAARDVMQAATAAGFGSPHRQVWARARKRARVTTSKGGMSAGWLWSLTP